MEIKATTGHHCFYQTRQNEKYLSEDMKEMEICHTFVV